MPDGVDTLWEIGEVGDGLEFGGQSVSPVCPNCLESHSIFRAFEKEYPARRIGPRARENRFQRSEFPVSLQRLPRCPSQDGGTFLFLAMFVKRGKIRAPRARKCFTGE